MKIRTGLTDYNVLFWNCNGKDSSRKLLACLLEIIKENNVKIVGLCESKNSFVNIEHELQKVDPNFYFVGESDLMSKIGYIRVFTCLPRGSFTKERKSKRYLSYAFLSKYDLCFLHLKSILSITNESKTMEDLSVIENILNTDSLENVTLKKFYIGDFNSTPYSNSLVNSRLFNSVRLGEARNSCHRKNHYEHKIYVNPCWELLGKKNEKIYGTIHNTTSDYANLGSYLFDQVIFDRDLINLYDDNSLKIIKSTQNHQLLSSRGVISIDYSDHLPIFFTIRG